MEVAMIGVNYKTAGLALQETVTRNALALFERQCDKLSPSKLLLTTCNRTEIYFSAENLEMESQLLRELLHVDEKLCWYSHFNQNCFAHLSRVVAGLDSAICMETEIVGQVRKAYRGACQTTRLASPLHYLFQKALKIGKAIRSRFDEERVSPSLIRVLYQIAEGMFEDVYSQKILLVGYSDIHRKFLAFLKRKGVKNVTLCSRKSEGIDHPHVVSREALQRWDQYDLISTATQGDGFLISGSSTGQHLIFDLGLPRNVDPSVECDKTILYNMEGINALMCSQKEQMQDLLIEVEHFLTTQVEHLFARYQEKDLKIPHEMGI